MARIAPTRGELEELAELFHEAGALAERFGFRTYASAARAAYGDLLHLARNMRQTEIFAPAELAPPRRAPGEAP